jgi:hypothetical protein
LIVDQIMALLLFGFNSERLSEILSFSVLLKGKIPLQIPLEALDSVECQYSRKAQGVLRGEQAWPVHSNLFSSERASWSIHEPSSCDALAER